MPHRIRREQNPKLRKLFLALLRCTRFVGLADASTASSTRTHTLCVFTGIYLGYPLHGIPCPCVGATISVVVIIIGSPVRPSVWGRDRERKRRHSRAQSRRLLWYHYCTRPQYNRFMALYCTHIIQHVHNARRLRIAKCRLFVGRSAGVRLYARARRLHNRAVLLLVLTQI